MLLSSLLVGALCQEPAPARTPEPEVESSVEVTLTPTAPSPDGSLRWSPKGAKVPVRPAPAGLIGEFHLGPAGTPPVRVALSYSPNSEHVDRLQIDCDRDGEFGKGELFTTTPRERRKKFWSSFTAIVQVPTGAGDEHQPYPMALWFVFDPAAKEQKPTLRWSRRGWHEGEFEHDGETVHVLLTEGVMDGVYTTDDSWQLGATRQELLTARGRAVSNHAWCGERAFRITSFTPDGKRITIAPHDPGMTRAEEVAKNDRTRADRMAKRSKHPLAFRHGPDYAAILAQGKREKKPVFLDFETTWCGPCKAMDQVVYTAADVVDAATKARVIAAKVDGDEYRDLVEKYGVKAYPTLILLGPDGNEIRRAVGYRSVAQMVEFFAL